MILLLLLIFVHEFSHMTTALYFKRNASKIIIYPFGGLTKVEGLLNSSIKEELIILIMGPIGQMIFYLIIFILFKNGYVNASTFNNLTYLNFFLIIFNMLPILPLDGGRLLNNLLNYKVSYKYSHIISIILSVIFIIGLIVFLLVYSIKIFYVLVLVLIIKNLVYEIKNHKIIFNKFVIERILYNFNYKEGEIINKINKLKRNKIHKFKIKNKIYSEKEYITKFYLKN